MLKFEILDASGNVSKVFETDKTVIKVGKLQTNDLIINDISVAPIHAQITVMNGSSIKIKDRGMGNGSYISPRAPRTRRRSSSSATSSQRRIR